MKEGRGKRERKEARDRKGERKKREGGRKEFLTKCSQPEVLLMPRSSLRVEDSNSTLSHKKQRAAAGVYAGGEFGPFFGTRLKQRRESLSAVCI